MSKERWEERHLPSSSFPGLGDMIDHITSGINMYHKENERELYQVQPLQRNETQKMYDLETVFCGHY